MNVNGFKSSFQDFLRLNRFEVQINRLNGQKLKFHVKSAGLPGSTIPAIPVPYMGRQIKIPGDRTYEDWNVNVMLDSTGQIRTDLYNWHEEINQTVGNVGPSAVNSIKSDGLITTFKYDGSPSLKYNFIGLFPTTVGNIEYSKDSNDTIAEVQVTFALDWFIKA